MHLHLLPEPHRAALLSSAWFAGLGYATQDRLLARARARALVPEQRVYSRGDEPDGVYAVLQGTVRVTGTSRVGRETVLDFYGPGSWFGEISAFDGRRRCHDVAAHGVPAVLLHVGPADLDDLLADCPDLGRAFLRMASQRLRILLVALESYSVQPLERRLAGRLLALAERFGTPTPEGTRIELHLPQETVARLIGSTRQRVNQIFKAWEHAGLIRQQYGRIVLLRPDRLRPRTRP